MKTFYIGLTGKQSADVAEDYFPKDIEIGLRTQVFDTVEGTFDVREGTKPVVQVLKVTVESISVDN